MVGGTPEFPGQLIASLLVAQWSERWCTSLVAQGSIPGMSRSESAITRGKTQMMLLPPTSFSGTTSYRLSWAVTITHVAEVEVICLQTLIYHKRKGLDPGVEFTKTDQADSDIVFLRISTIILTGSQP